MIVVLISRQSICHDKRLTDLHPCASVYPELCQWMDRVAGSCPHFFEVTRQFGSSEDGGVLKGLHVICGGRGLDRPAKARGPSRLSSMADDGEDDTFSRRIATHRRAWFAVQASANRAAFKVTRLLLPRIFGYIA